MSAEIHLQAYLFPKKYPIIPRVYKMRDKIETEAEKWEYSQVEFESIQRLVKNTTISFLDKGRGLPLVFLHGALVTKESWHNQIDAFSSEFRVIAPDFRGHGGTPANGQEHTIELYASDVIALLDQLGIQKAVFCGHSMGGFAAQEIALSYPERTEKIVLADTSYGIQTNLWDRAMSSLAHFFMKHTPPAALIKAFANSAGKHNPQTKAYMYHAMRNFTDNKQGLMQIWNAVEKFDSKDRLPDIACKTLIVSPEKNSQTVSQAKYMISTIPNSERVIVPKAGHMVMMDNPEEFNKTLKAFLI
ncbi:MAG: alpha/beta fold hydrolase [Spirochaetia bacterium]